MIQEKEQVRNADGKLLCEIYYDGYRWNLDIKKGSCYTSLILYPGGSFHVANESGEEPVSSVVLLG